MSQWPTRLANIGVRVSPRPRSAPVVTTCRPSNSWNAAATLHQDGCRSRPRAGSLVNSRTSGSAPTMKISAETDMNAECQRDHRAAGAGRPLDRTAADGVPDPDRSGRGQAERHHEGDAGQVERHLVGGKRNRIDAAGQRRDGAEDADLRRRAAWRPVRPGGTGARCRCHSTCRNGHVEQARPCARARGGGSRTQQRHRHEHARRGWSPTPRR